MRLRPAYADAFTGMGVALKELKRRDEAEACFSQVVRLRPGCALSLGNLAGVGFVTACAGVLFVPTLDMSIRQHLAGHGGQARAMLCA